MGEETETTKKTTKKKQSNLVAKSGRVNAACKYGGVRCGAGHVNVGMRQQH